MNSSQAANAGSTSLMGRVAVVTGASGGIGRAIAREFARRGASVVVHGHRRPEGLHALAAEICAGGGEANVQIADLADESACRRLVDAAWQWKSAVDVWTNVAGADVLTGDAASWTFETKLAALWQVDVLATIRLSRAAGERMKKRG